MKPLDPSLLSASFVLRHEVRGGAHHRAHLGRPHASHEDCTPPVPSISLEPTMLRISAIRPLGRRLVTWAALLRAMPFVLTLTASASAAAQMPGVPVLQNAFSNPGITIAGNYGHSDGATAYGGAAAWAPGTGRLVVSGGLGAYDPDVGKTQLSGGARAAVSLFSFMRGDVGTALFVGAGAAGRSGSTVYMLPIGVAVGYRRALGATRAFSVYGAPFYVYNRQKVGTVTTTANSFRGSVGVDVGLFSWLGATVGYEFGANATGTEPGARGGVFGIGASVALRH